MADMRIAEASQQQHQRYETIASLVSHDVPGTYYTYYMKIYDMCVQHAAPALYPV